MILTSVHGQHKRVRVHGPKLTPSATLSLLPAKGLPHTGVPSALLMVVPTQLTAQISPWPLILTLGRRLLKAAKVPHTLHYAGHSYHPPLSCRHQSISKWTTASCTISRTVTALMVEIASIHTAAPFAKKSATQYLVARINTLCSSYHYNRQCYISYIGCLCCCYHNLSFIFPWPHFNP